MKAGKDIIEGEDVKTFDCGKTVKIQKEILEKLLDECSCYSQAMAIVNEVQYGLIEFRFKKRYL